MGGGTKLVKSRPLTAFLYSSVVGILPNIAERTTTGVEASSD
mgnify:CR=1 FL=1